MDTVNVTEKPNPESPDFKKTDPSMLPPKRERFVDRIRLFDRILWIILVFFIWYLVIGGVFDMLLMKVFNGMKVSNSMHFVLEYYTATLGGVIALFLLCRLFWRNRGMLKRFIASIAKALSYKKFGYGILLGFLMNFFCIVCALLHGDIKLYFEFAPSGIPLMIFAFISVFIQSSCEEFWTRGFMYERINVHYPLWVAIAVNGVIFGLLHSFNDGISALAMADLIICGLSFSLLRWYSGSIWTCMGIHTMWNYTQNLIFGLPNSGLVSETSIFHMDAVNATSNLIYSYEFGVEGAVPALLMDFLLGAICLYLGWKAGRLGELLEVKDKKGQMIA